MMIINNQQLVTLVESFISRQVELKAVIQSTLIEIEGNAEDGPLAGFISFKGDHIHILSRPRYDSVELKDIDTTRGNAAIRRLVGSGVSKLFSYLESLSLDTETVYCRLNDGNVEVVIPNIATIMR